MQQCKDGTTRCVELMTSKKMNNKTLNTTDCRHRWLHVADFVQSSSSLLHNCQSTSTDSNAKNQCHSRRKSCSNFVAQAATTMIAALYSLELETCLFLIRQSARCPRKCLIAREYGFFMSMCNFPRIHFTYSLSPSSPSPEKHLQRHLCLLLLQRHVGQYGLGWKLTRTRAFAAVVDDSVEQRL